MRPSTMRGLASPLALLVASPAVAPTAAAPPTSLKVASFGGGGHTPRPFLFQLLADLLLLLILLVLLRLRRQHGGCSTRRGQEKGLA